MGDRTRETFRMGGETFCYDDIFEKQSVAWDMVSTIVQGKFVRVSRAELLEMKGFVLHRATHPDGLTLAEWFYHPDFWTPFKDVVQGDGWHFWWKSSTGRVWRTMIGLATWGDRPRDKTPTPIPEGVEVEVITPEKVRRREALRPGQAGIDDRWVKPGWRRFKGRPPVVRLRRPGDDGKDGE